ncbi:UDP-N-acetyl-D-mannosamine dehydrogenase [Thermoplasmatales archaeon]|nr:UDP-N-acetyl-D-mannosamine dehydrogenase [Thermoplasmatales archaeon]
MKLAVIGLGYVGLPLASLLSRDFDVIGFEVDRSKVESINRGKVPINEPGLDEELVKSLKSGRLTITSDPKNLKETTVKIVTVGTPFSLESNNVDYSQLESSLDAILPNLNKKDVIILKSTVPPGTTMGLVRKRIEAVGYRVPESIGLVFSPERMIEGQAMIDFRALPKVVGASDTRSQSIAVEILTKLGGKIITVTDPDTAEMVKMVDNYARFVFLGLTNELALACEKVGVDVLEVIRTAKDDYPRNAGLLVPGPGVGGSCLNKDPFILQAILRGRGLELDIVKSAQRVNSLMPIHVAELVSKYRHNGNVAILGVAFKGDTDDTRFAPSYAVRSELIRRKYGVRLTDPFVKGDGINKDLYESCNGASVVVVLTDHSEYKNIDLGRLKELMTENPLIIDGRGYIDRERAVKLGFEYHGLGRL